MTQAVVDLHLGLDLRRNFSSSLRQHFYEKQRVAPVAAWLFQVCA
jgi:hypothetical protein